MRELTVLFFLHLAAEIMLNMLFLSFFNNTVQYAKKKKKKGKNKAGTFTMIFAVGHPSSS